MIIGKENHTLLQILKKNDIEFIFKSQLNNDEVIQEYQNCDLLSFISTYEGFGLPIIEAQACGRAVITSKISSMPEVGGNGAYYVDPYDTEEIKKGILKIISDIEFRDNLIKKGLENVKRFDPKKIADQYNQVYKEITNVQ